MPVRRESGSLGQFDVIVDGRVIAGRGRGDSGGFLKRLFGRGFPDPEEVVAKIEELQRSKSGG